LPVLESVLGDGSESLCLRSARSLCLLCDAFGELIASTRSVLVAGGLGRGRAGLDVAQDERLRKCNRCHDVLLRVRGRLDPLRHYHRKHAPVLRQLDVLETALARVV
jgi:hypothetical protein